MRPAQIQFAKFVAVGGTSILSSITRYVANFVTPFEVAVVLAQIVGTRLYTEPGVCLSKVGALFPPNFRAILVDLVSIMIVSSASSLCYRLLLPPFHLPQLALVSHILGLAACTVPSFIGHKFFSFRRNHTV